MLLFVAVEHSLDLLFGCGIGLLADVAVMLIIIISG